MNEIKHLACPNCGANTSDFKNCEYCGSLLVRFVEKGIDLSQTTYLNNNETYPGLINALKFNLQLQESAKEEGVVTDIVGPVSHSVTGRDFILCVLRNGYNRYLDDTPIPSKSNNGICIMINFGFYIDKKGYEEFNANVDELHKRFKALDCYPLFNEHISFNTDDYGDKRKSYEYYIDFGKDAEGAARLISKIWKDVHKIPFDANIEYYTNAGDNIDKARESIMAETSDYEINSNETPNWVYWVVGIAFIASLIFTFAS